METKVVATKESSKKPVAAKNNSAKSAKKPAKAAKAAEKKNPRFKLRLPKFLKFLRPVGAYFKGAWQELRQVRWPNRRATWGLTFAVIAFTLFWVGVIIGLDAIYDYVFNEFIL